MTGQDIHKLLTDGERVILECKKSTKRRAEFFMGNLFRVCQYGGWYYSVGSA